MLERRPGVHRDGAQLDLDEEMPRISASRILIGSGDIQDHMVAAVAIGLDVFDIILFLYDNDAGKSLQAGDVFINVIHETAHHAKSDGVLHGIEGRLGGERKSFPRELLLHAVFCFQAIREMLVKHLSRLLFFCLAVGADAPRKAVHDSFERGFMGSVNGHRCS